ncbi:sigma-70 family RNA polymerase sigma factor [Nocardia arthritidis]|uniref:sigma-70 family RNA polymerase sigma factor n=1 Tax=Nocardia arthritidis TaxID=228602 RepID=UPI00142E2357|nr:sigma-70 family RNA polymerase sigma factor [Nocardia arthritidis]
MGADREQQILRYLPLVRREAGRYRVWRMQRDDLLQAGLVGLLVASDRYDPARGVPFGAYAQHWVRKEIQRTIAEQEFPSVIPPDLTGRAVALRQVLADRFGNVSVTAAVLGMSPAVALGLYRQLAATDPSADDVDAAAAAIPGTVFPQPEDSAVTHSLLELIAAVLARLEERQAAALILRFGLDGGPERSWREIGRLLGISDHTAKKLVERAQTALRNAYE